MTVFFRCDSSDFIGNGHIKRCLNLAKEIKKRESDAIFICNTFKGNIIEEIEKDFKVLKLPKSKSYIQKEQSTYKNINDFYKSWIGCDEKDDAINCLNLISNIKNLKIDFFVVDHYSLGEEWEKQIKIGLKNNNKLKNYFEPKILVIDDLFNRKHFCNILLNQNYYSEPSSEMYKSHVNNGAQLLMGPRYSLLSEEYSLIKNMYINRNQVKRILIYFGGGENKIHETIIRSIKNKKFKDIIFDYVISEDSKYYKFLKGWEVKLGNLFIHKTNPSLAGLMLRADLFLGAGGSTSWERLCLGIPSLVISVADNQLEICKNLSNKNYIKFIGKDYEIDSKIISNVLFESINNKIEINNKNDLVDGYGVKRVVNQLLGIKFPVHLENNNNLIENRNDSLFKKNLKIDNYFYLEENNLLNNGNLDKFEIKIDSFLIQNIYDNFSTPLGKVIFKIDKKNQVFLSINLDNYSKSNLQVLILKLINIIFVNFRENIFLSKFNFIGLCKSCKFFISNILDIKLSTNINNRKYFITILSDENSWMNDYISILISNLWLNDYKVRWIHNIEDIKEGDICFILSFSRVVSKNKLDLNKNNIVVHASDLPKGRGFSPMSWQILEGKNKIKLSLLEAVIEVDSGCIYMQDDINLKGFELVDEWRRLQAEKTISLCMDFIKNYPEIINKKNIQTGEGTYYPRRKKSDSIIDVNKSIKEQFNKLRIVDNKMYPAFFEINEKKFTIEIEDI